MATQLAETKGEAVEETAVTAAEEVVENNEGGTEERDYEAEAKAQGWRGPEEFPGDTTKFVDAKTFIERQETWAPLIKKERDHWKRKFGELERTMKQASAFYSKAEERAYTRALNELQAKHDEAVEAGDVKAGRAILKELHELEKPAAPADEKPVVNEAAERRKIAEWVDRTLWYGPDAARTKYADDVLVPLLGPAQEYEGGTEAWLAEIDKRVARKFAEPKPNPTNGGGNRSNGGPRGEKTFADLPPEAKAACDKFHRSGVFGDPAKVSQADARKQYAKDYDWS